MAVWFGLGDVLPALLVLAVVLGEECRWRARLVWRTE